MSTAGISKQLLTEARAGFADRFDQPPQWIAAAPGRVNLIGDHTDYNDGFALPLAVPRHVVIAAARPRETRDPSRVAVFSSTTGQERSIDVSQATIPHAGDWTDYLRGVLQGFRDLGRDSGPLDLWCHSNLPIGAGLSSSAALEIAFATLLEELSGGPLDPLEKILLCQRAENGYAGVPCGVLDQFSVTLAESGHLMLLDCRDITAKQISWKKPQMSLLVVNTGVPRANATSAYGQRRDECEQATVQLGRSLRGLTLIELNAAESRLSPLAYRRARHVVTENDRVLDTAQAIAADDWIRVGQNLYASHDSLKKEFEVSCTELDLLVELARQLGEERGVLGARMTGGGFGGCVVVLGATAQPERSLLRYAQAGQWRPA